MIVLSDRLIIHFFLTHQPIFLTSIGSLIVLLKCLGKTNHKYLIMVILILPILTGIKLPHRITQSKVKPLPYYGEVFRLQYFTHIPLPSPDEMDQLCCAVTELSSLRDPHLTTILEVTCTGETISLFIN